MIHLDDSIHKQVLNASVRQSLRIIIFAGIVTHWPVFSYLNQKMVLISNIILSPEEERISSLVIFLPSNHCTNSFQFWKTSSVASALSSRFVSLQLYTWLLLKALLYPSHSVF